MSQGAIHSAFSNMFCPHVTCRCNCTENPQLLLQNSHDMLHWVTDENKIQFLSYAMQISACYTSFRFVFFCLHECRRKCMYCFAYITFNSYSLQYNYEHIGDIKKRLKIWGTDENHFQFLSYAMQIFACHTGFSFGFRFGFFVCLCPYYNQSHTKKQKQTNFDWLQWCWSIYLILSYLMALIQYLSGACLVNMNTGVNACIALRI